MDPGVWNGWWPWGQGRRTVSRNKLKGELIGLSNLPAKEGEGEGQPKNNIGIESPGWREKWLIDKSSKM
jgi:hypothetical protein